MHDLDGSGQYEIPNSGPTLTRPLLLTCSVRLLKLTEPLTHFDDSGRSRMVDVGEKAVTARSATATGSVSMNHKTLERIRNQDVAKGDVLATARLAAIMGAKQTPNLIPLCHPVRLNSIDVHFEVSEKSESSTVGISATVTATDRTGVEMEALTAVVTAGLVIYDMCKSMDRAMVISDVKLKTKTGGKSGDYQREQND